MALKGTLKDFAVADIFQLIGQQMKSGSLYIRAETKEAHIVFDEGKIVLGTFRKSDEDFLLGTMLLRAGVITADQLNDAIENQKITLRSLGDILRTMGAISNETLGEFVSLQLKEILFRLFQWKEGFYEFVPEKIRYNKAIIQPQSAEGALMDGFRMLDEWPAILSKVGNLEIVLASVVEESDMGDGEETEEPPTSDDDLDAAFGDFEEEVAAPKKSSAKSKFSKMEVKILRLLDGFRSLQEIIYLSRIGTFEAAKVVADLLDRQYVTKIDQFGQTRIDPIALAQRETNLKEWLVAAVRPLLILFVLSLALPIVMFGVPSHWSEEYGTSSSPKGRVMNQVLPLSQLGRIHEYGRVIEELELYRMENAEYPISLDQLKTKNLGRDWKYRPADGGYSLSDPSARR